MYIHNFQFNGMYLHNFQFNGMYIHNFQFNGMYIHNFQFNGMYIHNFQFNGIYLHNFSVYHLSSKNHFYFQIYDYVFVENTLIVFSYLFKTQSISNTRLAPVKEVFPDKSYAGLTSTRKIQKIEIFKELLSKFQNVFFKHINDDNFIMLLPI